MFNFNARLLACALLIALPLSAMATRVYKSTAPDGSTVYSDQPSAQATEIDLGPLPPAKAAPAAAPPAAPAKPPEITKPTVYKTLRITQPTDDSVHWFAEGPVAVSVEIAPPLAEGHLLVPILNGVAQGEGVAATGFNLTDLDPDTYTLSVAIRDAAGKTLKQSAAVRFHFKRQSVNLPQRRPPPKTR
jgi:hypothetical protein